MKNLEPTHRIRPSIQAVAILALSSMSLAPVLAQGESPGTDELPDSLKVASSNEPFAKYRAIGSQQYVCLPKGEGFGWILFGPQATLFDREGNQVLTHFLSSHSPEAQTPGPTWQSSRDTSAVWGTPIASSTDSHYVAAGAIPWLLLQAVSVQVGPKGGDSLKQTTYIQRINTAGGFPPQSGCTQSGNVGSKTLEPYTADYVFYRPARSGR